MSELLPTLVAAFLTGLVGSAHCVGMCGGISGMFAIHAEQASLRSRMPFAISYNIGRVCSYAMLGFAVALLGSAAVSAIPALTGPLRITAGAVMILIGLQIAFDWRALQPVEKMGSIIWAKISPLAGTLVPVTTLPRALGLGLLWGWLPCGLVYSALLLAATSANAAQGAMTMVAFGLGTVPAMLMTGLGASQLAQLMRRTYARRGLGLLIVVIGILTLMMPVLAGLSGGPPAHH